MDVLSTKYKQHREEVLHALDVSKELLSLLTREGLLDIADCVKYQGIADKKKRTQALMKTLTERRTDRAYAILIQCLREAGLDKAADLLTDIGEETQIIVQSQKQLDEQISKVDSFLKTAEKRAGLEPAGKLKCGHVRHKISPNVATNDKEVWSGAQESMRRAADQLGRCQAVISKVHTDCQQVADTNARLMSQTRDCYLQLSKVIRPNHKSADEVQTATKTTQELFQLLVQDVHRLMTRKNKETERENEGRTSAMRSLRHLRDWIVDRSTVLNTLHATASPVGNPRFSVWRHGSSSSQGQYLKSFKTTDPQIIFQDQSSGSNRMTPPGITEGGRTDDLQGSFNQDHLISRPFATSTPQSVDHQTSSTTPSREIHIQPISSVVEGVHHLESQLREYIHLEIMLTDRFRQEMRLKQQQRKALGFSSKGIHDAQSIVNHLSVSSSAEIEGLHKLQSQLERISQEYNDCSRYMDKVVASMAHIDDVEMFLKNVYEREQDYKNRHKFEQSKEKEKNSKSKSKDKEKEKSKSKLKQNERRDPYEALVELFKEGSHPNHRFQNRSSRETKYALVSSSDKLHLPNISGCNNDKPSVSAPEHLVTKLKILVANNEIVRLRMLTMEDRFRREGARQERKADSAIRARDDEIYRLKTLLRETEAEKEKFHRLYENTKIGAVRRK